MIFMKWQFSMNSYNVICMKTNDYYKYNKHEGPHINLIISGRLYEKVKKDYTNSPQRKIAVQKPF